MKPFSIGIPIYKGVDLMDVAAPFEIFNWMGIYWSQAATNPRAAKVQLISNDLSTLKTRDGFTLTPDATFDDFDPPDNLDLIWVPGGDVQNLVRMMRDETYKGFLNDQAEGAQWVTSVCEGALILASAGLLKGYEVTTHWAFVKCLESFKGITVAPGLPRFVVDRNRVTGGGISSGIDEALELTARISSYDIAKQVQAVTQYFPRPPIRGDMPEPGPCPLGHL